MSTLSRLVSVLAFALLASTAVAAEPPPRKHSNVQRLALDRLAAVHADVEALKRKRKDIPPLPGLTDYRCILHAHAEDSDAHRRHAARNAGRREEGRRPAPILLTDHYRPPRDFIDGRWRGLKDGVLFIPGSEARGFLVYPSHSILQRMDLKGDRLHRHRHRRRRPDLPLPHRGAEGPPRRRPDGSWRSTTATTTPSATSPRSSRSWPCSPTPSSWPISRRPCGSIPTSCWPFSATTRRLPGEVGRGHETTSALTGVAANDCHHNQVFIVKMVDAETVLLGTNVDPDDKMRKVTADVRPGIREMTKGRKPGDVLARLDIDPYFRSFRNSATHVLAAEAGRTGHPGRAQGRPRLRGARLDGRRDRLSLRGR